MTSEKQQELEKTIRKVARGSAAGAAGDDAQQYLTFQLDGETFGVGIMRVREIIEYRDVTPVPLTPEFIRGVINLRGNVVPVVDLRVRFGGRRKEAGKRSCIVIVEVTHEGDMLEIGILVDAVNEVINIPRADIEPPPQFGANLRVDFIHGMGNVNERFIILLNQDKVLSVEELALIDNLGREEAGESQADAQSD